MDFEHVYREHYRRVASSAWSVCRDRTRSEEFAQEAFARAYARWNALVRGGYAVAWVHRVALNLAIDDARRRARDRRPEVVAAATPGAPFPVDPAGDRWLVDQLCRLPRRQREAVFLRVVVDLPEVECAAAMGVSPGSVKTHRSRGIARLRDLLDGQEV